MSEIDITSFKGSYGFLSNFAPVVITYKGLEFPSTENAYQASKGISLEHAVQCQNVTPGVSKALGKLCTLRDDFDDIKVDIMMEINLQKYMHDEYALQLVHTGYRKLIEGNWWHDNFWGDCYCDKCKDIPGQNNLGIILMKIRDIIGSG